MISSYLEINTKGNTDITNITPQLTRIIEKHKVKDGVIFLSVVGSTAAITTMEYENGLVKDLKETFEKVLPYQENYAHNATWADDNGHAHLRSSFIKTNFFVSITDGNLDLGTWQQVVLIDFDTRPRKRKIVTKILTQAI